MAVSKRRGVLLGLRSRRSQEPESPPAREEGQPESKPDVLDTWVPSPGGEPARDPSTERELWMTLATQRTRSSDAPTEEPGTWVQGGGAADGQQNEAPTQSWLPPEEPDPESVVAEEPPAEEPAAEEPVAEEPVAEEPVAEEPVEPEPVGPARRRVPPSCWRPIGSGPS